MAASAKLIQKEYTNLCKNPSRYLQVYDVEDMFKWTVFIIAPDGTPYEKGIYRALIRFPDTYPMDPPSVQFVSPIYHPNIYRDGKVCMSTIQNPAPAHLQQAGDDPLLNWRPVLGIEQVIVSLVSMLADPNCDDPANRDCAQLFMTDHDAYLSKAKESAQKSLQEIPDDFVVVPPCDHPAEEPQNQSVDVMEMSWQSDDGSDEGIVQYSDASSDVDSDDEADEDERTATNESQSSKGGACAEEAGSKQMSDAEVAAQLQAELDRR